MVKSIGSITYEMKGEVRRSNFMMHPTTNINVDDEGRSNFSSVDLSASAYSRKKNEELKCLFGNKQRHVSEIVQSMNERGIGRVSLLATQVDPLLLRRTSSSPRSIAGDALGDRHGSDSNVGKENMVMIDRVEECKDSAAEVVVDDDVKHEDLVSPTSITGMENYLQQSLHDTVTEMSSSIPSLSDRKNAIIVDTAPTFDHTSVISVDKKVVEAKAAKGERQKSSEKLRMTVDDEVTSLTAALTRIHSVMESKILGSDDKMDECRTLAKQIEDALVEKQEFLNTKKMTPKRTILSSLTISSGQAVMNKKMNSANNTFDDDNVAIPFQEKVSPIKRELPDVENYRKQSPDARRVSPAIVEESYNYPSIEEDDDVVESAYLSVIEVLHLSEQDNSSIYNSSTHNGKELDVSVWSFSAVGRDYDKNTSIDVGNITNIADCDTSNDSLTDADQKARCIWKESPQKSFNSFESDDAVITRIESEPQRMFTVIEPDDIEAETGPNSSNIVVEELPLRQTYERHGLRQEGNNIDTVVQQKASTKCACVIM